MRCFAKRFRSKRRRGDADAEEMIRDRRGEGRVVAHANRLVPTPVRLTSVVLVVTGVLVKAE